MPACDTKAIDAHVDRADFVLLSHWDHAMGMPHIARKTGAVIGTESTANVARAGRVTDEQIVTVQGGEDDEFGRLSVKVVPSLHSALSGKHSWSSGTVPRDRTPLRLRDDSEGGTLAYVVRLGGRQLLMFGSMNEGWPFGAPPDEALAQAEMVVAEVRAVAPRSRVVVPRHLDTVVVGAERRVPTVVPWRGRS